MNIDKTHLLLDSINVLSTKSNHSAKISNLIEDIRTELNKPVEVSIQYEIVDRHMVYDLISKMPVTREHLRDIAKKHNIPRGRSKDDTIGNIAYQSSIPIVITITL